MPCFTTQKEGLKTHQLRGRFPVQKHQFADFFIEEEGASTDTDVFPFFHNWASVSPSFLPSLSPLSLLLTLFRSTFSPSLSFSFSLSFPFSLSSVRTCHQPSPPSSLNPQHFISSDRSQQSQMSVEAAGGSVRARRE